MKKILVLLIMCSMIFSGLHPLSISANEQPEVCSTLPTDIQPIETYNFDINNIYFSDDEGTKHHVIFDNGDAYYLDGNGDKVYLIEVIHSDVIVNDPIEPIADPSYSTFVTDFEYIRSYKNTTVKVPYLAKKGVEIVFDMLIGSLVSTISGPLGVVISTFGSDVLMLAAEYAMENPGDSEVMYNLRYYRSLHCPTYLTGQGFSVTADMQSINSMGYSWTWGENPSLSIVGNMCKLIAQKYPYRT